MDHRDPYLNCSRGMQFSCSLHTRQTLLHIFSLVVSQLPTETNGGMSRKWKPTGRARLERRQGSRTYCHVRGRDPDPGPRAACFRECLAMSCRHEKLMLRLSRRGM